MREEETVSDLLDAAAGFVWRTGRLIDRHRFTHLFEGGERGPVLAALAAYQNPDGGFGNALEPDLRGPGSRSRWPSGCSTRSAPWTTRWWPGPATGW
jgi:hypothetical protein